MINGAVLKTLAVSLAAAALGLTACARPDETSMAPLETFDACAQSSLFKTDAVKGNEAGSALAIGNDPAFVMLNGTSLTQSLTRAVTAEGPYAKEALKEYKVCAPSFTGGMS